MRAVRWGRLGPKGIHRAWAITLGLPLCGLLARCNVSVSGQYACTTGFASCVNPDQNSCETNIQSDSLNCGGCNNAAAGPVGLMCPLGAPCTDATCGSAAAKPGGPAGLSTGSSSSAIATNSSAVFWSDGSTIISAPLSGGSAASVAPNANMCGQSVSFAVDDTYVYYFSSGFNCTQPGSCAGLVKAPLSGGAPTVLVPAPTSGNVNQCGPLALSPDGSSLYGLTTSQQQGNVSTRSLYQVSVAGTTPPNTLATMQSMNGFSSNRLVVTATAAIFVTQDTNNGQQFEVVPLSGGPPTAIPLNCAPGGNPCLDTGGLRDFAADSSNIYVVGSYCRCNNNGGSYNGPPSGSVGKIPIGGGSRQLLAPVTGQASSIAVDEARGEVYWSTDMAVWKAPVAGGAAVAVAGDLTNRQPAATCNGCGGGGSTTYENDLAVGPTNLYIADHQPMADALLEVPK